MKFTDQLDPLSHMMLSKALELLVQEPGFNAKFTELVVAYRWMRNGKATVEEVIACLSDLLQS